jgi:hypothetical protein
MSADDVGASPPARGAESVAPTPAKACPGPRCNGPQGVARLETVPFRPRSGTASGMLRAMESTRRDRTAQRSVLGACAVALVLLATGGAAWGDEGPQAATTAEALFRDGRRLMAEGRYAEACPKFVAAGKLEATTGTALNKGECFERLGKLASAWAGFDEARTLAKRSGEGARADEAARRMALLEPRLSTVLLQAPPGGLPAGSSIRLDGQAVDAAALGTAIPVDAGSHTVEVAGAAGGSWSTTVEVAAEPKTVPVPLQAPVAPADTGVAPQSAWGPQRISGVVIGSAGVASVVVGAVLGVVAILQNKASNAEGNCLTNNPVLCPPHGYDLRVSAGNMADASTATFIAGGVLLVGGGALFFTAPSSSPRSTAGFHGVAVWPTVGAHTSGIALGGRW